MNDQLTQLLEQLATKFGTTVEYLWGVLVMQAYVAATVTLIWFVLSVGYIIAYVVFVKHIMKRDYYDDYEPAAIIGFIFAIVAACFALFAPYEIITGYFNPEYWALKQILK